MPKHQYNCPCLDCNPDGSVTKEFGKKDRKMPKNGALIFIMDEEDKLVAINAPQPEDVNAVMTPMEREIVRIFKEHRKYKAILQEIAKYDEEDVFDCAWCCAAKLAKDTLEIQKGTEKCQKTQQ